MQPQTTTADPTQTIRRLLRRGGVLVAVIVVGWIIINFASTGTLTVTTNSASSAITVTSAPNQAGTVATTKKGTSNLTIRLRAGAYVVSVQGSTATTNQLVEVGWLTNKTVDVVVPNPATPEPVAYGNFQDVIADNNQMSYLSNDPNGGVQYINSQNQVTFVAGSQLLTPVAWADTHYGVGQDADGNLYAINGATIRPLALPPSSNSTPIFSIAPDHTIYVAIGQNVYRSSGQNSFRQIYNNFAADDRLVATNGKVLIAASDHKTQKGTVIIISTDGKKITKTFGSPVYGTTPWSRTGQYIVLSVGQQPALYDASLNQLSIIPQPAVNNNSGTSYRSIISDGSWLGDTTVFYHFNSQLWTYNVSQQSARLLVDMSNSGLIMNVSASLDGSYVYVVTSNDGQNPQAIFRVGLLGQTVSSTLTQLAAVLPINYSLYTLGLRNFAGPPIITVNVSVGSDPTIALQSAQDALQGVVGANALKFEIEEGD